MSSPALSIVQNRKRELTQIMKVLYSFLSATALAGPKFNLNTVLDNLNEINEWATEMELQGRSGLIDDGLAQFQSQFATAAQFGATRKEVRALEQRGRRVLLDDMIQLVDGIDISKLSGYGCYGTPIDRYTLTW